METAIPLRGVPLSMKVRLLLPGWPCGTCSEHQQRQSAAARRCHPRPHPHRALGLQTNTAPPGLPLPPPRAAERGGLRASVAANQRAPQRPERRGAPPHPTAHPIGSSGDDVTADLPGGQQRRLQPGSSSTGNEGQGPRGSSSGHRSSSTSSNSTSSNSSNFRGKWNRRVVAPGGRGPASQGGHGDAKKVNGSDAGEGSRAGGGGGMSNLVARADVDTWAQLVRQYGTSSGGTFAANALFRAAHFVDSSGMLLLAADGAAALRLQEGGGAASPSWSPASPSQRSSPPIDTATFSELVQQLLAPATEAALAGRLDAVRSCRLLWALAKLSGSAGEGGGSGAAGHGRKEEGGGDAAASAAPRGAALPRSAMQRSGGHCAAALASQLQLRVAEEGDGKVPGPHGQEGAEGRSGGLKGARQGAAAAAAGGGGADADGLTGRLLVMAMWGLARLTGEGHMRYGAAGLAAQGGVSAVAAPLQQLQQRGLVAPVDAGVSRSELWDGLCEALRRRLRGLPAREISNAMWALGAVRHCHHPVFGELAAALQPHLTEAGVEGQQSRAGRAAGAGGGSCNAQDLANAVWALARAGPGGAGGEAPSRLLVASEAATLTLLPLLRSQHVASLLSSFVTLRFRPRRRVDPASLTSTASAAAGVGGGIGTGTGTGGATSSPHSLPQPQPRPHPQRQRQQSDPSWSGQGPCNMYQLLRRRAWELQLFRQGDVGEVAQVVWALAKEQLADERLLVAAAQRLRAGAGRLTLREAAMVASAYRMARYVDAGLSSALLRRAGSLSRWELLEVPHADVSVALLLRGLAWAGHYDQAVYTRLCDALTRHLATIEPQPLALALWALAETQHRQSAFLSAATTTATAIVGRFSGGELSCTALSLARLGVRDADFFSAAAVTLTALRGGGGGGGGRDGGGDGAATAAAAEAARQRKLEFEQRSLWKRTAELVPGEAAPLYGENEAPYEDEDEDEDDVSAYELGEAEGEELEDGEGAEGLYEMEYGEGEEEEEEEEAEKGSAAGVGLVAGSSVSSAAKRMRRRGGRRYWLQRAATALRSNRWRRIDLLNPLELANVMAAFAISGNVDELLYYRAQVRTRRLLNASSVLRRDAAAAAAAAGGSGGDGSGGGGPAAAAAAALRRGDPVAGSDLSAAAVTKLLWAFVAVGLQEPPLLCALAGRLRQLLQRLEPRDIAALAWALAVARLPDCGDLLDRAVRAAAQHAAAFKPADLATVAWAAATSGLLNPGLMQASAALVLEAPKQPSTTHGSRSAPAEGDVAGMPRTAGVAEPSADAAKVAATFAAGGVGTAARLIPAPAGAPAAAGAAGAAAAAAAGLPSLKVLSDVAWAHSALRLYHPQLLARAAELGEVRLRVAAAAAAAAAEAAAVDAVSPAAFRVEEEAGKEGKEEMVDPAPWLPPDLDLNHVVALLEAHATWAAAPVPPVVDGGVSFSLSVSAAAAGGSCYHDGLFRAAARVLLSRLDELTSDEVVTLTWSCTAVLYELPPPPRPAAAQVPAPASQPGPCDLGAQEQPPSPSQSSYHPHHHPVLELLAALSDLIAATPADSFLQPELAQLAQAHAMSVQYGMQAAAMTEAEALPAVSAASSAAALPAPAPCRAACEGPLMLPPALLHRVQGAWGAAPAVRSRRLVVELCAALEEMGFGDVQIDARSEDGLVPVDVRATGPPRQQLPRTHGSRGEATPTVQAGQRQAAGAVPYAFFIATSELRAVGQPHVHWGPLGVRVRLMQARGWRVVVVPSPPAAQGGGRMDAAQRRDYVRQVLRAALEELAAV